MILQHIFTSLQTSFDIKKRKEKQIDRLIRLTMLRQKNVMPREKQIILSQYTTIFDFEKNV
jgi:hypothetical protein